MQVNNQVFMFKIYLFTYKFTFLQKKKEEKYETMDEKAALAYYEMMKDGRRKGPADEDDNEE